MKAWKFWRFSWTPTAPKRRPVSETLDSRHVGKAMCASTPEGVTITTDCLTCGEVVTGPIHPLHLRSLAAMIDQMGDALGLPSREDSINHHLNEVISQGDARLDDVMAKVQEKFSKMDVGEIAEKFDRGEISNDPPPHGVSSSDIMRLLGGKPGKVH